MRGTVVIVDAYQPTRRLAPTFRGAGYGCVRVQSTPEPPRVYRSAFPLDDYLANIVHNGDFDRTLREVARYEPAAVVPGGEIGVEFADALSEALGLPSNGTATSDARRDKFTMIETLRRAGVRAARQILVDDEESLRAWHIAVGGRLVVKPTRGSGGEGVHFCDTPEESVAALHRIVGARNLFSQTNSAAVAQEYLPGTEYVVNTVSRDGRHHVCDLWRTTRINANGVPDLCDAVHLMARSGVIQDQLVEYAELVLDALGIRHGPGHLEVKLTPDGPCLVEVGARIPGADLPHYARLAVGESQLDWIVDAYVRPDRFHQRWTEHYRLRRHVASVAMISTVDGILRGYRDLDAIRRLDSHHEIRQLVRPGERIRPTVDDLTYPLITTLVHEVEEFVLRDAGTLRFLDGPDFYRLESAPTTGCHR
jgi:biotin carboxylase